MWSCENTYVPSAVSEPFRYLFDEILSRKIAGAEVHAEERGLHAADLLQQCAPRNLAVAIKQVPVLHSDNGAPIKAPVSDRASVTITGTQSRCIARSTIVPNGSIADLKRYKRHANGSPSLWRSSTPSIVIAAFAL